MRPNLFFTRAALALSLVVQAACATANHTSVNSDLSTRASELEQGRNALYRADSAYKAGSYTLAADLYEWVVTHDNPPASLAVFRLATLRSWDNKFEEAVALYRRYIQQQPTDAEGPIALARTLAWGAHYDSAIAIYDSLIAARKRVRDASVDRAQTLAWAGRTRESLDAYRAWLKDNPTDRDAAIAYARTLAWNGQLDEAEARYTELAKTGNAAATKGLARVIGWRGDLERSEQTWRRVLETDPNDPEALTGLAQVLSWEGRQTDAESALEQALRANPSYGDARALMRWVQADLRPSVTVTGTGINDSDNNRSTAWSADYAARAWWSGMVGAKYNGRAANFAAIDSRADMFSLYGKWQPLASTWQLRGEAGVARHSTTFVSPTDAKKSIASFGLGASGKIGRALSVGVSAARTPFDETALLIANGVVSSDISGDAAVSLPARLVLAGGASHSKFTGGTRENARNAYNATLRWNQSRNWSIAVGGRQFGYDTTSTDGYFSPRRYALGEVTSRGHLGSNLGWYSDAEVGVGRQRVEFFGSSANSRATERGALSLGYRFDPAREISASGIYANVAGPAQTTSSEYHWYTFALRARLGF
ncbi:MAG TPA: tetratricopeptide repeat protein [Gemmatimonadaceae bacterium]|nr:tetratricopeptide repeat protein [Gemmatimonadaceae bacterium]